MGFYICPVSLALLTPKKWVIAFFKIFDSKYLEILSVKRQAATDEGIEYNSYKYVCMEWE